MLLSERCYQNEGRAGGNLDVRQCELGNVLTSFSGSTFPRRLNATGHLLRGSCFAPHFIFAYALRFEAVKGETKWIEAICYR